jgi:p-cumate 2,3-dioxygenase alpha subunit
MDQSALSTLIDDDRERGLFRINRRAFVDPEVLALERREIFNRCWLYAGHASEVPEPGRFLTRKVGGRPVLMLRDNDGEVRVLLNSCPHRGNLVCRERSGSAQRFTCFYHAWTFGLTGDLIGVPGEDGYSPAFDRAANGLTPAPRLEVYRGLVFVAFDRDAMPLIDYFGNAREYLDLMLDFAGDDLEIVPGAQNYSMRANWKLLVENSIDSYHAMPTHQRYFSKFLGDMGIDNSRWRGTNRGAFGRGLALDHGHSLIESQAGQLPLSQQSQPELDAIRRALDERFGREQAHRIADYSRNLFIFPNLIFVANWRTIRTFYPVSHDYMEIESWALLPRGESPALRQSRLENFVSFLGPAGFGTPDDVEGLEGCQRGFANVAEQGWSDVSRGMLRDQATSMDELQMRAFWRRWHACIQGQHGPTDCSDRPKQGAIAA